MIPAGMPITVPRHRAMPTGDRTIKTRPTPEAFPEGTSKKGDDFFGLPGEEGMDQKSDHDKGDGGDEQEYAHPHIVMALWMVETAFNPGLPLLGPESDHLFP